MMSSSTSTDTGTTGTTDITTTTTTTTTIPTPQSALFVGTSREVGRYFHVQSLPGRHHEKLGLKLINCDTGGAGSSGGSAGSSSGGDHGGVVLDPTAAVMEYQFYPGYALVGGYTDDNDNDNDGPYRNVIRPGDMIIAINGRGFRRFAYQEGDEDEIEMEIEVNTINNTNSNNTTEITIPPPTNTMMAPVELDHAVVPPGTMAYRQLLEKIKAVQLASGDPPLTLTLIRYDWDARPFAWRRFLLAAEAVSSSTLSSSLSSLSTTISSTTTTTPIKKNNNVVPEALRRHQNHLQWRNETFPVDISSPGVQAIFSTRTIASIHRTTNTTDDNEDEHENGTDTSAATDTAAAGDHHHHHNKNNVAVVPVVYVNYGRLLRLLEPAGTITATDVRHALLVVTEQMLAASCNGGGGGDPRFPSVTLLIDVSSVSSSSQSLSSDGAGAGGSVTALSTLFQPTVLRVDLWRDLYRTFEPNYPETLHQLIVYPVNAVLVRCFTIVLCIRFVGLVRLVDLVWYYIPFYSGVSLQQRDLGGDILIFVDCMGLICLLLALVLVLIQAKTVRALLQTFVNDTTRRKLVLAVDATQACQALRWDADRVTAAGGIQAYVHAHCRAGRHHRRRSHRPNDE
jgi:hypothetical protein